MSRRDVKAPEIESLGSFQVLASILEAATSCLGLILDKILNVSVSSRSRLRRSHAHPCTAVYGFIVVYVQNRSCLAYVYLWLLNFLGTRIGPN